MDDYVVHEVHLVRLVVVVVLIDDLDDDVDEDATVHHHHHHRRRRHHRLPSDGLDVDVVLVVEAVVVVVGDHRVVSPYRHVDVVGYYCCCDCYLDELDDLDA